MKKKIFIVDDNEVSLLAAEAVLEEKYEVLTMLSAKEMFSLLEKIQPDLILLDIEMPEMNGFEAMKELKSLDSVCDIPVIFLTGLHDAACEAFGIELGAVDFIMKPFSAPVLLNRIKNHLHIDEIIRERTAQIERIKNGIVFIMGNLVENRDNNTGGHINRTVRYLKTLIDEMVVQKVYTDEMAGWNAESVVASAPLHDLGKIVIPDSILNKPGPLTNDEYQTMKQHTMEGKRIIDEAIKFTGDAGVLHDAGLIAAHHHERWDGTGYPYGLKEREISLHGRVMSIIDVYDALVYERPYKEALSHEEAVRIIMEDSGSRFDPLIADVFYKVNKRILAMKN